MFFFDVVKHPKFIERAVRVIERLETDMKKGYDKASTDLDNLLDKADTILIGGAMAFTFQKALGFNIGNSMVEDEQLQVSLDIINRSKTSKANLLFPADFVCTKDVNDFDSIEVKMIDSFVVSFFRR